MRLRWWLIAQIASFGALAFAFPSAGSAFSGAPILLTASGPSPAVLTLSAGMYPFWSNSDQVTHTVALANGLCTLELAPGATGFCPFGFSVGQYPYTVDGTTQGSVVVNALPPTTVTLTAERHTVAKRHAYLRLHGKLRASLCCLPPPPVIRMRVVVLARQDGHHPFHHSATVRSETLTHEASVYSWRLRIHLKKTTIYVAKVTYQPEGEPGLRTSWSRPFKVVVRARR